eukprot:TRINITY_DN781982_c0_g1_i1.p1 TRINITY_DN781982_c0_g1~~TRINITY_DN781982_c0_g1_i1.p1  ORF type:complete len:139 (-),score=16.38 TRINITY_DN781982_c0_g1_i1:171-545(-)
MRVFRWILLLFVITVASGYIIDTQKPLRADFKAPVHSCRLKMYESVHHFAQMNLHTNFPKLQVRAFHVEPQIVFYGEKDVQIETIEVSELSVEEIASLLCRAFDVECGSVFNQIREYKKKFDEL